MAADAAQDQGPEDVGSYLREISEVNGAALASAACARALDAASTFSARSHFAIPPHRPSAASDGGGGEAEPSVYLTGHSLGLQPRSAQGAVMCELTKWAERGVAGHFEGELPWASCEEAVVPLLGELVGAADATLEVAAMNSLTVNLHLLMAAFYRPSAGRAGILIEAGAFPSDRYAVASQVRHHGHDPAEWLTEVAPREESGLLSTHDLLAAIDTLQDSLALAIARGVRRINSSRAARSEPPILLGLDLAHAAGNVPLSLHDWGVDFAAWCTYKYLNAGAGCLGAIFVHSRHAADDGALCPALRRLTGWWGVPHAPGPRFEMRRGRLEGPSARRDGAPASHEPLRRRHGFDAAPGAAGFACSNVNPLMPAGYLELLLHEEELTVPRAAAQAQPARCGIRIITPADPRRRGCQLSLRAESGSGPPGAMRELEAALLSRGVVVDAREPDIVRAAPVPLYNSYEDVRVFVLRLADALVELARRWEK
ncbi:kynureninase [Emiliania huxleyi CCMP1516]|uniref:Kynureninase n=2 Tax=Emiliania huxleyi TaxID=2903 RepID=A0A0D3J4J8_EMIH1|nr:kynureninase [Emiliania huxleyi CCMP1516]EOD18433.1 kynureninase [Emiliania huxleyi CCMP1516]|eukprot:XP_005770862.1 kynureninase [Emiliania huxleyi CCMP1516]